MILKECMLVENKCYIANSPARMTGIVVHDTGAGNPNLKRYVQPKSYQSYYNDVIADLGVNKSGNDWNGILRNGSKERFACVHAFIGRNADGVVETYQTLPYNICAWGVGDGSKGSYNYNPQARIQFEICDDGYRSESYFYEAMKEAQEYCAFLCRKFGWGVEKICSHHESYSQGYGGNHGDCDIWLDRFGKDMNWFRTEVQKILNESEESPMTTAEKKEFESLQKEVSALKDELEQIKVFHYWSEIKEEAPWAYNPLKALYDKGYFSGASASDLNVPLVMLRSLVCMAAMLRKQGLLNYE